MTKLLSGMMILDLGQVIAGNYGSMLLADLGAEVIKVEPLTGDIARNANIAPVQTESSIHLFMNRGKKSISLDLKSPEGKQIFLDLVAQADAVIDNFRPGVLARLGIDYESLTAVKPDLVTASVTGFGQEGPYSERPAFDLVVQAYTGHIDITGEPDRPPSRVGIPLADISGGIFACISVLSGLLGRELHGTGGRADVGMMDTLVSMLSYDAVGYLNTGEPVRRMGTAHAHMIPWQAFPVDDGYVVVTAREEKFWERLCEALGRPDLLGDERAQGNATRVQNREWVVAELTRSFAGKTKTEWMKILTDHDIPAAPVNTLEELFTDPQVSAREMVQSYQHPTLGEVRYPRSPVRFDAREQPRESAPMLGQHTREILSERLGLDDAVIDGLVERNVLRVWAGTEQPLRSNG